MAHHTNYYFESYLTFKLQISIPLLHSLKPLISKMSAPREGRQSPEPETQSGAQLSDPPSHGKLDDTSTDPAPEFSYEKADGKGPRLPGSNPTHRLEEIEAEKSKR